MGTMSMMGQFLLLTNYVLHKKCFTCSPLILLLQKLNGLNYTKPFGHENVKVELNVNLSNTNTMCISYTFLKVQTDILTLTLPEISKFKSCKLYQLMLHVLLN